MHQKQKTQISFLSGVSFARCARFRGLASLLLFILLSFYVINGKYASLSSLLLCETASELI